jgi:hypothetical protein
MGKSNGLFNVRGDNAKSNGLLEEKMRKAMVFYRGQMRKAMVF